jgi:uncharacterized protein YkwD
MQKIIITLLLLISSISFCQETKIDFEELDTKVSDLINNHRNTLRLKSLEKDIFLKKAAEDQSSYIAKTKTLSHEQTTKNKKMPINRVDFYQGQEFILVGENLLYTGIQDKTYSDIDLDVLAAKIFNLWKNSPNHYKNMINSKYYYAEFGFCLDWKNKRIYVAQVFGAK